jgi:ABC-type glycerol-3-phosphate transport system substrate-binding protein
LPFTYCDTRRTAMKRLAIAVTVLAIGAAGCGSSSTPASPSTTKIFTVQLSALNEVPPVTNAESTARGTAVITIDSVKNTVDFNVSLNSFPAGSAVNIAHIHGPARAGNNANVVISTTLTPGNVALTNGAGTFTFLQVPASAALIQQILADPSNWYFNVHTTLNGGGAVRGWLQ